VGTDGLEPSKNRTRLPKVLRIRSKIPGVEPLWKAPELDNSFPTTKIVRFIGV
jgi:hypothetical protein